ncbi:MAG: MXAN_2755 family glutamic-type intramembrane protease [Myxococcaceae bacterium]
MNALAQRFARLSAVQEVFLLWAVGFIGIIVAFAAFGGSGGHAKVVATVGFLYLPLLAMRRRGEDYRDYGITLRAWREDLKLFGILFAVVFPVYVAGFWLFANHARELVPEWALPYVTPYLERADFEFRLPARFGEWVIDNVLVVALPEEFFYRGFVQGRLRDAWPQGKRFLGARLGPAFWVTQLLFAVGHLAIFEAWRLAVVFPALLFGWMRERTGTVMGAALFHAACNLLALVLEASFFGRHG